MVSADKPLCTILRRIQLMQARIQSWYLRVWSKDSLGTSTVYARSRTTYSLLTWSTMWPSMRISSPSSFTEWKRDRRPGVLPGPSSRVYSIKMTLSSIQSKSSPTSNGRMTSHSESLTETASKRWCPLETATGLFLTPPMSPWNNSSTMDPTLCITLNNTRIRLVLHSKDFSGNTRRLSLTDSWASKTREAPKITSMWSRDSSEGCQFNSTTVSITSRWLRL